ncbi:hypothetical protein JR316_0000130 [Psilocybe cubensis]|uniref:Uncharacterized protein n=1 Tax=Psilocybe cubensis TaxID=181762 RepID=A0ACB8HDQ5_PSICU|nr:hypothetical protein JR316_0000130 [Psilocybe cubensis]KAH9486066.1 hypothetical protein JR316_0000130 [Psilocybe cubensis]
MDMPISTAGISHISTHFSNGEMSGKENALRDILMDPDKRIGKKSRTRTHFKESPEWYSGSTSDSAAAAVVEGISKYRARRSRGGTSHDCTSANPFCESGLDGCLGGF